MERVSEVVVPADRGTTVDQANRLYLAMARAGRSLRATSSSPIGTGSYSALWSLTAKGPMRLSDLADVESVTRPTMTRIVAALEQRGYVDREPDPVDGRAQLVAASRAGKALVARGSADRVKALTGRIEALSPEEAARIEETIALLETLAKG
jgi:DNA-binding MarR family transcriptional regulator